MSMYSPRVATIINYTTNYYYSVFSSKQDHYRFLSKVVPKSNIYRINYIKKAKKTKESDDTVVQLLATKLEISKREINYYISTNNIDIERLKKICQ